MTQNIQTCPECGAAWLNGQTCQDDFHQMLAWENEFPENWSVHHLMVPGYYLQHPSLYSPEGLSSAKKLLVEFVVKETPPQQMRSRITQEVSSKNRQFKITGSDAGRGAYTHPVNWRMRAADVVAAGPQAYIEQVRCWAQAILEDLRQSANLEED